MQDNVGSRHKMSSDRRRKIRRAAPAMQKGHIRKGPSKNSDGRGNPTVRTFRKKQRTRSDYNNGIKGRGTREESLQRMRRTSDRTAKKTVRLELVRLIVRSAVGLKEMNNSAF
jgi:hypothetical protein